VSPAVATPLLEEATQQASVYQLLIIRRDTIVTDYFIGPTRSIGRVHVYVRGDNF